MAPPTELPIAQPLEQEAPISRTAQGGLPKVLAVAAAVLLGAALIMWGIPKGQPQSELSTAYSKPSSVEPAVAATPTFMKPSSRLVWEDGYETKERFEGDLTVPLDPNIDADDAKNPQLKLRIRARPSATQPAPLGTILVHCGGPGSGRTCLETFIGKQNSPFLDEETANLYNIIGIDQRAIGLSEPRVGCETNVTLPSIGARPKPHELFPDCPCSGLTSSNFNFAGDEWAHELQYYEDLNQAFKECYNMSQLKMGDYNVMDYTGTAYLAHDMDLFRAAVGAEKLSVNGVSYGTMVGSVYASLYPENAGKIVLDGNAPPAANADDWTREAAINWQAVRAEYVHRCREFEGCSSRDPEEAFRALTKLLDEGKFQADTDFGKVSVMPSHVVGQMHGVLRDYTHFRNDSGLVYYLQFANIVNEMLDISEAGNETEYTIKLLDAQCSVKVPVKQVDACKDKNGASLAQDVNHTSGWFTCPTWKQYGICVSGPESKASIQSLLMYTGVWSGDIPSKMLPSQSVGMVKRLKADFGVVGVNAGHWLDFSTHWPGKASYPGIGTRDVAPLITTQLHDSATGFKWSQEMKLAFPKSHMMTTTGMWHGAYSPFQLLNKTKDHKGIYDCWLAQQTYIKTGELPRNGFVCHVEVFGVDEMSVDGSRPQLPALLKLRMK